MDNFVQVGLLLVGQNFKHCDSFYRVLRKFTGQIEALCLNTEKRDVFDSDCRVEVFADENPPVFYEGGRTCA